jgi:hypothetical protein
MIKTRSEIEEKIGTRRREAEAELQEIFSKAEDNFKKLLTMKIEKACYSLLSYTDPKISTNSFEIFPNEIKDYLETYPTFTTDSLREDVIRLMYEVIEEEPLYFYVMEITGNPDRKLIIDISYDKIVIAKMEKSGYTTMIDR